MPVWKDIPKHTGYEMSDAGVVRNKRTNRLVGKKVFLSHEEEKKTLDVEKVYQRLQPFESE
jgi:hypothetical protein